VAQSISAAVAAHQAASAEQRRRAVEERRQHDLSQRRSALLRRIDNLSTAVHQHGVASYADWAQGLDSLVPLNNLEEKARRATDISELETIGLELHSATVAVHSIVSAARRAEQAEISRQRMERLQAEASRALESLELLSAITDPALGKKFDAPGTQRIEAVTSQARMLLDEGQYETAIARAREASALINDHASRVQRARERWLREREEAQASHRKSEDHLRSLSSDSIVIAWCREDLDRLNRELGECHDTLDHEQWDRAKGMAQRISGELVKVSDRARIRETEEEERRYVVRSIVAVLREQGFYTDTPQLLSEDPNSDVVIQAVRSDDQCLEIGIQRHGQVRYEVDGSSRIIASSAEKGKLAECPEAVSTIMAVHEQLESDFGVLMEEPWWEDRPVDVTQIAKPLRQVALRGSSQGGRS